MDEKTFKLTQQALEHEARLHQDLEAKVRELLVPKQKFMAQKHETEAVKQELDNCKADAVVYKQVGPVLLKQAVDEAKTTINERLSFIEKQLEGVDAKLKETMDAQNKSRQKFIQLQQLLRKAQEQAIEEMQKRQASMAAGASAPPAVPGVAAPGAPGS